MKIVIVIGLIVSCLFWFAVGMVARYFYIKKGVYEKGEQSEKGVVRFFADFVKWIIYIVIYGNVVLIMLIIMLSFMIKFSGRNIFGDKVVWNLKNGKGSFSYLERDVIRKIEKYAEDNKTDKIKSYFSDYAQSEGISKDDLKRFCDKIPSEAKLGKRTSGGTRKKDAEAYGSGTNLYVYEAQANIDYEKSSECYIDIVWIKEDTDNPKKQGIHSIQYISKSAYDNGNYEIHYENDAPGVYIYE